MPNITNLLANYVKQQRKIDGVMFRPLFNQTQSNTPLGLEKAFFDIQKVFGWKAANPNEYIRRKEIEMLYVEPQVGTIKTLVSFITNRMGPELALVVGKRGAGKTALCNYAVTVHFEELQNKNTTWLRCDVAKLHAINEEVITLHKIHPEKRWTVNDYMALHGFSVMLEYGGKDKVFSTTLSEERDWIDPNPSPLEKRLENASKELAEAWKLVRNTDQGRRKGIAMGSLRKEKDQDLKWYFQQLYSSVHGSIADRLFREIISYVYSDYKVKYGINPILLFIFDGVDNLRSDEHAPPNMQLAKMTARQWYLGYLEELRQYINAAGACLPADKYILAIRDDTEVDLGPIERANQYRQAAAVTKIEVKNPDAALYFKKNFEYVRTTTDICSEDEPLVKTERLALFEWFYDEFIKTHLKAISHCHVERVGKDANDVLAIVFNSNLRSFTRNLIRSLAYFHRFSLSLNDFKECTNAEDRMTFYKRHSAIVMEASVLS